MKQDKKLSKHAFTLAEVLITLGIIGIVAAMTMPTLTAKTTEKENATKLKKIFSTMSQAYMQAKNEYGTMDNWGMAGQIVGDDGELDYNQEDAVIIIEKLSPYLKTTKVCKKEIGCWYPDKIKQIDGKATNESFDADGKTRTSLILADGGMISIVGVNPACTGHRGEGFLYNVCGAFAVDTNGNNRPNQLGHDIFQFYFTKEGIVPYGTERENVWTFSNGCSMSKGSGWGCSAWVIYQGNMDYLRCNDLTWDNKTKCN